MAEKAIRLGGESTADAIVSAVDAMYTEHTFAEKDFALKHNEDEISVDTNFAAQNFWKEALIRFFNKKSAVLGLVLIVIIVLLAVLGPGMNSYTYSGQDLSQKNFAPRVPGIEQFGILDGSEKMSTTTGTKVTNAYQEKDKLDVYYWLRVRDAADHHHPFQDGHHQPADPQAGARRSHRGHLLHRRCGHPAGHRVPVHGGFPHGAAVFRQHLPERHLL